MIYSDAKSVLYQTSGNSFKLAAVSFPILLIILWLFSFWHKREFPIHLVLPLPQSWNQPFLQRVLVPFSAKWYFRSQGLDHWVCSLMLVDRANEHRHVLCVCVCVNTQTHTYTHSNFYLNIYFCICFYIEKHQFTLKPILVFCPICNSFLWY